MRITKLYIKNFRGLNRLEIELGGSDALIIGENGTGKTSVLDAVTWLFTGKVSSGKRAEISNLNNPSGKIVVTMEFDNGVRVRSSRGGEISNLNNSGGKTVVTMEFDNGVTLRRENSGYCYVQGVPCKVTDFKTQVDAIFKGAVPVLLNPFNFCKMHYADRRNILLSLFGEVELDLAEFAEIAEDLQKITPEEIIRRERLELKKLEREAASIPVLIAELSPEEEYPPAEIVTGQLDAVKNELAVNLEQLQKVQEIQKSNLAAENEAFRLESSINAMHAQYSMNETKIKALREEYSKMQQAMKGTCPLCKSKIPAPNLSSLKTRLSKIIDDGRELAEKQKLLESAVTVAAAKAEQLKKSITPLPELQTVLAERDKLQRKSAALQAELAEVQRAARNLEKVEALKKREMQLGKSKTLCDKKIFLAEEYIHRKIELTENAINSHFELVKFKMFDTYKVSDGVKECCEPMMNGIPYEYLSKGEKLKASLDILKALQKAYGVEMPVFIDDAESYTSNSLIDVPNQKILLRAIEGVKTLSVQKVGVACENPPGV